MVVMLLPSEVIMLDEIRAQRLPSTPAAFSSKR